MTGATGLGAQVERMRTAIEPVVVMGPDFLTGQSTADEMAHTMVGAVETFISREQALEKAGAQAGGGSTAATVRAASELEAVLHEIYVCGSGYLAGRCDADCVARTITQIVGEFGRHG